MANLAEPVKNREDPIPLAEGGGVVSQAKACKMLEDGSVNGTPLTESQKRFFGMVCGGDQPIRAEAGAVVLPPTPAGDRTNRALMECLLEDPDFLKNLP